jgi:hypothetical protein
MKIDKLRRGKAFPQPSITFKIPLIWECFAHNLTTQGQLKVKRKKEKGKRKNRENWVFPFALLLLT